MICFSNNFSLFCFQEDFSVQLRSELTSQGAKMETQWVSQWISHKTTNIEKLLLICSKAVMSFLGRRIKRINDKMFLKIAIFLRWGIIVSASKIMTEKFRGSIKIKNTYLMSRNGLIIELKLCQKLTLVPIVLLVWNNF